jgi:predicted nucleic acid-binding protein
MPLVVVDTCVVSYLYSGIPLADKYRERIGEDDKAISFMTLAELYYGTLKRGWSDANRDALLTHVARDYDVLPFDVRLCAQWAEVRDQTRRLGRLIRVADSWIAATALLYNASLATHNRKHFEVLEPRLHLISEAPES